MLPTEPLSVGGVVDAGISFYRATFRRTLKLALIAAVPYAVASALLNMITESIAPDLEANPDPELAMQALMALAPLMPLSILGLNFMLIAVGHRLVALARNELVSISEDLIAGLKLMIPLSLVMMLYMVLTTIGFLLLLVPGVILSVSMCLFIYVPLMEKRSAWSSLWRSHALVWRGNWWRTLAVISIIMVVALVVSVAFSVIGLGLRVVGPAPEMGQVVGILAGFVSGLVMAILVPLSTCMFLALYNDLQLRRDGDDLDARFAKLDDNTLEA